MVYLRDRALHLGKNLISKIIIYGQEETKKNSTSGGAGGKIELC